MTGTAISRHDASGPGVPGRTAPAKAWMAVSMAMFVSAWGGNEFTPLLVMYREHGGLSDVAVDSLLFLYVLGIVPALLIGGPLSDRFGRRPLMVPAPLFAALGSLLLALGADSFALLCAGRIFSGVALGLAMAVGGSWIVELSAAAGIGKATGAKRGAMSLTAGFGLGAGLAAALAQWGPWPHVTPYAVNIALAAICFVWLLSAPETRAPARGADASRSRPIRALLADLRIPGLAHRRYLLVVLPIAPWVFGTAASAYAIIPALMTDRTSGAPIAFAGLCCVLGLSAGFALQTVGRRIDDPGSVRAPVVAMLLVAAGITIAVIASSVLTIWVALLAATVLGCGYGMAMVAGLLEIQRIAGPHNLAGLTAVFYGVTYIGFAMPVLLAWISETWAGVTYPAMFGAGVVVALICLVIVVVGHRVDRGARASRDDLSGVDAG